MAEINRIFFEGKYIWLCLSPKNPLILHETDTKNQVMLYDTQIYDNFSDTQNIDFGLFELIKHSNLDITDAAGHEIVHI